MTIELKPYLRTALAEYSGRKPQEINLNDKLIDDLRMDSLDIIALAIDIENAEGVSVDDEELGQAVTVRDVSAFVDSLADNARTRL